MITQADDRGLLAAAHRQLLGTLYPLDDDVTVPILLGWVEELVEIGLVRWRKTRDEVPVLELVNWGKHQRIDNAGRSQLGALLADEPLPASPIGAPGDPSDVRGESPRVAADRGLDHRPPTKEQGSPAIGEAALALARRANQGLAEHPTKPQPIPRIIGTAARSHAAAEEILAAGVPLAFAESAVYELAKSNTAEGEVRSLKYFVAGVVRAFQEAQEGTAAAGDRPDPTPTRKRGRGDRGAPQQYAYTGSTEKARWQE